MKVHRDYSICVVQEYQSISSAASGKRWCCSYGTGFAGIEDLKSDQILHAGTTDPERLDSLRGDPDGIGLYKLKRWYLRCRRDIWMLEMTGTWDFLQAILQTTSRTYPREKNHVLKATKPEVQDYPIPLRIRQYLQKPQMLVALCLPCWMLVFLGWDLFSCYSPIPPHFYCFYWTLYFSLPYPSFYLLPCSPRYRFTQEISFSTSHVD